MTTKLAPTLSSGQGQALLVPDCRTALVANATGQADIISTFINDWVVSCFKFYPLGPLWLLFDCSLLNKVR